jgi:D-tyrosyl-tRNA(Tyr) deacylase
VHVADETIATIGPGLTVLLGIAADDRPGDGERIAAKILALRIFDDGRGRLDRTCRTLAEASW